MKTFQKIGHVFATLGEYFWNPPYIRAIYSTWTMIMYYNSVLNINKISSVINALSSYCLLNWLCIVDVNSFGAFSMFFDTFITNSCCNSTIISTSEHILILFGEYTKTEVYFIQCRSKQMSDDIWNDLNLQRNTLKKHCI